MPSALPEQANAVSDQLPIMQRLKEETLPQHERAESKPLEQVMIKGEIARDLYVQVLAQRHWIHAALEQRVRDLASVDDRFTTLVPEELYQRENIAADLRFFDADPDGHPALPATRALLDEIEALAAKRPTALLGVYYVFEGSKNGARFIARNLSRSLKITGPDGLRYLDPHGEQQRPLWLAFRERMNEIPFSASERDEIVEAAKRTFDHIAAIDDELFSATPPRQEG